MPSISFYTMGCNVNVAETEKLRAFFINKGFDVFGGTGGDYNAGGEGGAADVIVINSCAVTSVAEKGALQLLHRLRAKNWRAVIALVGCVGEMLISKKKWIPPDGLNILIGCNKSILYDMVMYYLEKRVKYTTGVEGTRLGDKATDENVISSTEIKDIIYTNNISARSFVLVQNGCDCFCSYCVVPRLRGKPVSVPLDEIARELEAKAAAGCKEVVLSGINLALYKDGSNTLIDVLRTADAIPGIKRIRLSSLEPGAITAEFIKALPNIRKICPHFHISLQSGCDATLRAMNRGYTVKDFLKMLAHLRIALPDVSVTTDVIVGFPGESDEHFRQSCRGIVRCLFDDIHIFKFSAREGTAAATMPDQVTEHKKTARATHLQGIKQQALYRFLHGFIWKDADVLFFNQISTGYWEGTTPHNAVVRVRSDVPLLNKIRKTRIINVDETGSFLEGSIFE